MYPIRSQYNTAKTFFQNLEIMETNINERSSSALHQNDRVRNQRIKDCKASFLANN